MQNNIDVLLVARPDHSMQIYQALLKQNRISYIFLTYKVFPDWLNKLFHFKKMTTVSKNAICSWKLTFINLCRFKFKFHFAQKWDETTAFNRNLKSIFNNNDVKLIHYWPEYGDVEILKYANLHPGVRVFADIHMPHPVAVYETMKPIYQKYGIDPETTQLALMAKERCDFAGNVTDILVPSSYVADTYKTIYKEKNYHVVSYGITVSESYEKHSYEKITEFVYVGRISLEKGSDLLLEYFSTHPEYNIHLYGGIIDGQKQVFEPYKNYKNIIFHGFVPKVEIQKHIKHYHVGIHLSRFDAYSLAVGERIGCGLPVIVSDHTGNMDDVRNEQFGIVTSLDLQEIGEAIQTITKPDIYNLFQESINSYIIKNEKTYADNIIEFYKENLI